MIFIAASESMETSFSPPTTSTTSAMECTVTGMKNGLNVGKMIF